MKPVLRRALVTLAALALALAAYAATPDAVTPDGGRYYGPLVDGRLHGRGRIEYPNGTVYDGEFRDGMYSGQGKLRYYNGDVYEGEFNRGEFTGKGRHTRKDRASYEGGFRDWKFHGPGRYSDQSGTIYEGNFTDGSLDGPGKVTGHGTSYEGELKQWRYHGRGVLRHRNGDVYKGSFENGLYEGEGTLKYAKPREDGRTQDRGMWRYGMLPDEKERRRILADTEAALYAQRNLLDKALASLKPGEPGRINLYLLAVAGDGSQEVFRREVDFVEKAFAERFGTAGRSVALINSRNTLTSAPMATVTSIRAALQAIGTRMNRDQDILFLFVTSHGSREHELTLNQRGMQLRGLGAAELAEALRESAIRWKVVVVSACYSGGFVDALKDERTLVITAARRDRASFGCADENDFTYFGRAFFKEALPDARSFQQAFSKASVLVEEWERKDAADAAKAAKAAGGKPKAAEESRSLPQIHSPAAIEAHLQRWWAQLPSGGTTRQ